MRRMRTAKGQAIPEFLLPLAAALLLTLLTVEAARVSYATIALRGAIREAALYATSGEWSPEAVASGVNYNVDVADPSVLDVLVPCTPDDDTIFLDHWGIDCDPQDPAHQALRVDLARLISITEVARQAARERGIELLNGYAIAGLSSVNGPVDDLFPYDTDRPGYMQVWMCSNRQPTVTGIDPTFTGSRYQALGEGRKRRCAVMQPQTPPGYGPLRQTNQYDAGGAGDTVEIVITYHLPLTPPAAMVARQLGLKDYIPVTVRIAVANNAPENFGGITASEPTDDLTIPAQTDGGGAGG